MFSIKLKAIPSRAGNLYRAKVTARLVTQAKAYLEKPTT